MQATKEKGNCDVVEGMFITDAYLSRGYYVL